MKLVTFALFLMSNSVFAVDFPFNGGWSGDGTLVIGNDKSNCSSVQLIVDQRDKAFLIKSILFLCGPNGVAFEGMSFGAQNGSLYLGQDVVGTYTDTEARFEVEQKISNYVAKWTGVLAFVNDDLVLQESRTVTSRGNTEFMYGEAVLTKAN
jgi:hypothetical protein